MASIIEISQFPDDTEGVFIYFRKDGCGPCKNTEIEIGLAEVNVEFNKFDVMSDLALARREGLLSVPVIRYYRNGEHVQLSPGETIAEFVSRALG